MEKAILPSTHESSHADMPSSAVEYIDFTHKAREKIGDIALSNPDDEIKVIGLIRDSMVQGHKQLIAQDTIQKQLEAEARQDPLTGLANRRMFNEVLGRALSEATSPGQILVIAVDGDGVKAINDTLGHEAGDATIMSIANTLKDTVRGDGISPPKDTYYREQRINPGSMRDLVARTGGDEFRVLMLSPDGFSPEAILEIKDRFVFSGSAMENLYSVGVATNQEGDTPKTLDRRADLEQIAAKQERKSKATFMGNQATTTGSVDVSYSLPDGTPVEPITRRSYTS
jgi:GGDEF domain-containing protein